MPEIKLLIVDDHPVFRQGLRDVLETDDKLSVIGEAADGEVAIELSYQISPDVVLMDINLPTINGLQATKKLKGILPDVAVIVITGYDDAEQVFHAFRAGASAYCPKDITPEALIKTIYAVRDGLYVVGEKTMPYEDVLVWLENKLGQGAGDLDSETEDFVCPVIST